MDSVILPSVPITHTLVLATSTRKMLVVQVHAPVELDQAATAISLLARATRILERATSIERTSVLLTCVLTESSRTPTTVIRILVPITRTPVLVINTRSCLEMVVQARAPEL